MNLRKSKQVIVIATLFMGIVIALSLAFGLAFGLGGKEAAADYIKKLQKQTADHRHCSSRR